MKREWHLGGSCYPFRKGVALKSSLPLCFLGWGGKDVECLFCGSFSELNVPWSASPFLSVFPPGRQLECKGKFPDGCRSRKQTKLQNIKKWWKITQLYSDSWCFQNCSSVAQEEGGEHLITACSTGFLYAKWNKTDNEKPLLSPVSLHCMTP